MPVTVTYAKIIKKGKEGGMLHLEKLIKLQNFIHICIEEKVSCTCSIRTRHNLVCYCTQREKEGLNILQQQAYILKNIIVLENGNK